MSQTNAVHITLHLAGLTCCCPIHEFRLSHQQKLYSICQNILSLTSLRAHSLTIHTSTQNALYIYHTLVACSMKPGRNINTPSKSTNPDFRETDR